MKLKIDRIKEKTVPILKEAGVTRAALFGSVIRGKTSEESDIDILVDLPKDKSLFGFVGLQIKLEEALGKKVDLVEYSTIKTRLKPYILNNQFPIL